MVLHARVLATLPLLVMAASAPAQVGVFILFDETTVYEHRELLGHRWTAVAGQGAFYSAFERSDLHTWFWYRAGNDTREYALAGQKRYGLTDNTAFMEFVEPVEGFGDEALSVRLEYNLRQIAFGNGKIRIDFQMTNVTSRPYQLDLFHYADIDLVDTWLNDTAEIRGQFDEEHHVFDPEGHRFVQRASTEGLIGYELDRYPNLLAKFSNNDIDDLANGAKYLPVGDYTGAYQWRKVLAPGQTLRGYVEQEIMIVPEPSSLLGVAALAASIKRRRRPSTF